MMHLCITQCTYWTPLEETMTAGREIRWIGPRQLSSLSSAGLTESSMSASVALVKPALMSNLRMNRPILVRSASSAKPHHAGPAYKMRLLVVALLTVRKECSSRPSALRTRSAYREPAQHTEKQGRVGHVVSNFTVQAVYFSKMKLLPK